MNCYDVMLNGCTVGTAAVEPEGLYKRIRIQCKPPDAQIYALIMLCGSKQMDLGVCVPENDLFVLNRRIQTKLIGEEDLQFYLVTRQNEIQTMFVPLDSEKPFAYLDRLPGARFENRNGTCGLVLMKQ